MAPLIHLLFTCAACCAGRADSTSHCLSGGVCSSANSSCPCPCLVVQSKLVQLAVAGSEPPTTALSAWSNTTTCHSHCHVGIRQHSAHSGHTILDRGRISVYIAVTTQAHTTGVGLSRVHHPTGSRVAHASDPLLKRGMLGYVQSMYVMAQ